MFEFLKSIQLDLMLVLSGISAATAFFMALTKTMDRERKFYLILTNIFSVVLLLSDRAAYLYRGDTSAFGYLMVRVSNFMVFAMVLFILWAFNHYVRDIYVDETGLKTVPFRLRLIDYLIITGVILLIISQYTGLYYTFDATNHYQRSQGYVIGMSIPLAVLLLQLSVVIQYHKYLRKSLIASLILFTTMPLVAGVLQLKFYGLSLINITTGFLSTMLYLFALRDMNQTVDRARKIEIDYLKKETEETRHLFTQTAEALASAIDAKDKYTKGHSSRVAEYSRKIAELAGKNQQECDEIYYAALLHDVGKIGISRSILTKDGKLTEEEYEEIKQHPVIGAQILSSISESPYLSIGAQSHHERYDGRGYPSGLKGNDIPEIARIIAVADAYDAMTSKRSYRDAVPQQVVREEFVKCTGTQFDPEFAKIMLHLIDLDSEYQMKEKEEVKELSGKSELVCKQYRTSVSEGIVVTDEKTNIKLTSTPDAGYSPEHAMPSIILFDSLDARIHEDEKNAQRLNYFEYAEIRFDGTFVCKGARKIQPQVKKNENFEMISKSISYNVEAVKIKDHVLIRILSDMARLEFIIALPDSARWAYMGLTGENCHITNVSIDREEGSVPADYIPRIAEEISYINVPAGDLPNIQSDGYRSAATDGILLGNYLTVTFHSMSLPTARLVWHCPYISLFSSDDGKVGGPNFHEYALIRLDGENWDSDDYATNDFRINKLSDNYDWNAWKELNKKGIDCSVNIKHKGNTVTLKTENAGIEITNITTIKDGSPYVYVALTGDQCAITNIRVKDS